MKIKLLILFISGVLTFGFGQTDDDVLKTIYTTSLTNGHSYQWLDYLSNTIGGRLSGSTNAELAVLYTISKMRPWRARFFLWTRTGKNTVSLRASKLRNLKKHLMMLNYKKSEGWESGIHNRIYQNSRIMRIILRMVLL